MPSVLIPVADGTEEIEAVTLIDILRRAGAQVTVASVSSAERTITASRGTRIEADTLIHSIEGAQQWDLIALPGGMPGAEHLAASGILQSKIMAHWREGRILAAICAAPAICLGPWGLLAGKQATGHPAFAEILAGYAAEALDRPVVADGQLLTSQGPGTAMDLALTLVEKLFGEAQRQAVEEPLIRPSYPG